MITSIIRYHTAIYCIMSITRDRFRSNWVSSSVCKKHSIINMLKNKFAIGCKKICNTKQYDTAIPISWGSHLRTHTHMTLTTSQLGQNRSRVIDMMHGSNAGVSEPGFLNFFARDVWRALSVLSITMKR